MNKYQNIIPITRNQAEELLASADVEKVTTALVSIAFYEKEWQWAQDTCLIYLYHSNYIISGLAATCLGHVARVHGQIEKVKVLSELRKRLSDLQIAGKVEDAINDIEMYVKD